ncbi:MAG TPA: hypothetical protein VFC63_05115 [Blastocatellia bacterium]|nr:hypothetical protein [Blastocatellia bacterium]
MEEEINEPRKVCPVCDKKYSGGDNYCHDDGSHLVIAATEAPSAKPQIVRDTDPDLHAPSGHSEQGQ